MKVLVDLESLFDFRLGRLLTLDAGNAYTVVQQYDQYKARAHDCLWDSFPVVREDYLAVALDKTLWMKSPLTEVPNLILEGVAAYYANPSKTTRSLTVHIDMQGIRLTDEETKVLIKLVTAKLGAGANVFLRDTGKFDPKKVNKDYDLAIIYDVEGRVMPTLTDENKAIRRCTIYTPFRFKEEYRNKHAEFAHLDKSINYQADYMTKLEDHLRAGVSLHFMDMAYFCGVPSLM